MVDNPAMYDTYTFKTEDHSYSTFKITEVFEDSIYVDQNDYEIDELSEIYKIDKEENYPGDIYVVTKAEIKEMFNDGDIKDIERD